MKTGRRSFFKILGGALAGFTLQGKLRAQEIAKAQRYHEGFLKQRLSPMKPLAGRDVTDEYLYSGTYSLSGCYATGVMRCDFAPTSGYVICCSG